MYRTPFEAFLGHPRASDFLKRGVSIEKLKNIAYQRSDNECAASMQKAKQELFKKLTNHRTQSPATYDSYLGLMS